MYTKARADWWIARSRSPEYQAAYDIVAERTPLQEDQILVDVACGPGEMLKRMHKKYPSAAFVATDASPYMLKINQKNWVLRA